MPSYFKQADLKEKTTAACVRRRHKGTRMCKTYFRLFLYFLSIERGLRCLFTAGRKGVDKSMKGQKGRVKIGKKT